MGGYPNLVGPVRITGDRNHYFTTASSPLAAPLAISGPWQRPFRGLFGTAGRNSLRGPGFFQWDLSLNKTVQLRETTSMQFRVDFYNLLNRVNLGNPGGCVDCSADSFQGIGDKITTLAVGAIQRQIEFGLRLRF